MTSIAKRWAFFVMPLRWLRRGCYDWRAHRAAWKFAFGRMRAIAGKEPKT